MDIELADIEIDGKLRKTLIQAPKNGFFYVLDRITGELISAEPYTAVTWASRVDRRTGRPVEMPDARFKNGKAVRIKPGTMGAHNWMPMAYSPDTQLVYLPVVDIEMEFNDINYDWQPAKDRSVDGGLALAAGPYAGFKPASGQLLAWSPAEQKAVWKVEQPTYLNGGVLATGGKLVFQGTIDGILKAYDAGSGKVLWQFDAKAPILAAPIAYEVEGTQYITVLTGSGMAFPMYAGMMLGEMVEKFGIDPRSQDRRVLTFALGGNKALPARRLPPPAVDDDDFVADPAASAAGMAEFFSHCTTCHGAMAVGIGNGPDLRRSAMILDETLFDQVVRGGVLESRGMPKFAEFDNAKVASIRHYLRDQARRLRIGDASQSLSPGKAGM